MRFWARCWRSAMAVYNYEGTPPPASPPPASPPSIPATPQPKSDPSFFGVVREVMGADTTPHRADDWVRDYVRDKRTYQILAAVGALGVVLVLIGFLAFTDPNATGVGLVLLAVGGGLIALCYYGLRFLWQQRPAVEAYDREERLHRWEMEKLGASHTPAYLDALTKIEIERDRIAGAFTAEDLKYLWERKKIELTEAEAKRVREHQAAESAKDREAKRNAVQDSVKAKIDLLTHQHSLANPSTEEEKLRRDFQFQSKMDTLQRIYQLAEADQATGQTLFEMWERGEV